MIWLDIKELETKISTNELSEKDSFNPDSAIEKNHYFYALNPNA